MKNVIGVGSIIMTLAITGCQNKNTLDGKQAEFNMLKDKMAEMEATTTIHEQTSEENEQEFSYLKSFTEDELEGYKRFFEEKDIQYLADFSPERILLLFFHSTVIDDVEAVYSLTYHDGTIPDLSTFRKKYYTEGLDKKMMETTLDYRFYDSIEVKEEDHDENETFVEIGVKFGHFHAVDRYGLKKENGIWKMDILHI